MIPIHYTATFSDSDERFHGDLKLNIDFETDAEIAERLKRVNNTANCTAQAVDGRWCYGLAFSISLLTLKQNAHEFKNVHTKISVEFCSTL